MADQTTWQDVTRVLMLRWPAGPGNKGWEHEQLAGYIAELQVDRLTPHWALVGLRASGSGFIPSVGEVRELARAAKGPPTTEQIVEAEERFYRERAERVERALANGPARQIGPA